MGKQPYHAVDDGRRDPTPILVLLIGIVALVVLLF